MTIRDLLFAGRLGHDPKVMTIRCFAYFMSIRGLVAAGAIALGLTGCSLVDALQGEGEPGTSNPGNPGTPGGPGGPVNPTCSTGSLVSFLSVDLAAGPVDNFFEGQVAVRAHDITPDNKRLVLDLSQNGEQITFNYQLADLDESLALDEAGIYQASIAVQTPFWIDAVLVLREDGGAGGNEAPLVAALWDTSEELFSDTSLRDITVNYVSVDCEPTNDGCGDVAPLDLDVKLPSSSQPVRLSPGNETLADGFRVMNSVQSNEYVGAINCTDTPGRRMSGYILGPRALP